MIDEHSDREARALGRARAGDESAFQELVAPYRRELHLHCYRILGSLQDAEDTVQETLLAAWRGLAGFEKRASLRAWLYRIATNRCLNLLRDRKRRPQEVPTMAQPPTPTRMAEPMWLDPYPDALLDEIVDTAPGPASRYETRESVGLAFAAALQHLPPRQRAALVLREVLGFHTSEVAGMLDTTETSVKSALQRARATLDQRVSAGALQRAPMPGSLLERDLVGRFATAVEQGDTEAVISLLTDDAWLTMPPQPYEYQGPLAIAGFIVAERSGRRDANLRLVATRANGQPAFGCYLPDPQAEVLRAYGLMVLTLAEDQVSAITWFGERSLLAQFGLPRTLPR
ncbi:MAG TPA: sigma-70 family RNA polymerase sigma factor [Candidatus Limnocylindrales bacterium]|nr:sigma-70 family RNA polymerase sigma factor [Candidatus Limnocylindrales bacterium]